MIGIERAVIVEFTGRLEDISDGGGDYCAMLCFYNKDGVYIGNEDNVKTLIYKYGISPESFDGHKVCSIGKSIKDGKWYGWSHRAIYGFSIGDTVKEGDCCASSGFTVEYLNGHPEEDTSLDVGFEAKTEDDCKKMAMAFADSVS
jgi:hypothetical protein